MPLYTFHPCRPDGTSDTFVTVELRGDRDVPAVAVDLLARHRNCHAIEVWQDERQVAEIRRDEAATG
jgi:hypothetical protein